MRKIKDWELWDRLSSHVKATEPINKKEENEIYALLKTNKDKHVRSRLIEGYMWLVLHISSQLFVEELGDRDDIVNSGILELCRCADKFEARENKKFLTFAGRCIRGKMWKEIRKRDGMMPIPRLKGDLGGRMSNIVSLSTIVKDDLKRGSPCELWEMIADPNQVDVDAKIDRERFEKKFREVFDKVLFDMPLSNYFILYNSGMLDGYELSITELAKIENRSRGYVYKHLNRGMEALRKSGEMRELMDSL